MDSIGVQAGSDCLGDLVVSFYAVSFGEVDAYVDGGDHFYVGELPDV